MAGKSKKIKLVTLEDLLRNSTGQQVAEILLQYNSPSEVMQFVQDMLARIIDDVGDVERQADESGYLEEEVMSLQSEVEDLETEKSELEEEIEKLNA